MKVIRASVLGFCMGVRKAVDIASGAARGYPVYTIGPLIHNPAVLSNLEKLGIKSAGDVSGLKDSDVIIRAHGVSPDTEKALKENGCRIIDATCPNVKKNQLTAQELSRGGYHLFLAGEKEHAEITGLLGYCAEAVFCQTAADARQAENAAKKLYKKNKDAKTALIGQTTISMEEYDAAAKKIKKYFPDLKIINTICAATGERQNALRELLPLSDAVLVAGGKQSANTRRLLMIARQSGKPCAVVQSAQEIPLKFFSFNTVGICAGASTPDFVIDEIEKSLIRVCL